MSGDSWIERLRAGDGAAAQELWQRYFARLAALARRKLGHANRRVADEEDVALSALDSFCRGAARGRFPDLKDRNNLWSLLVLITARKALDLQQQERRQKRGGGKVRGDSVFINVRDASSDAGGLDQFLGYEPSPALAAQITEECDRLLQALGDPDLRLVAQWKLEGYTNAEIARKLNCVTGTIERKLRVIRTVWSKETSK